MLFRSAPVDYGATVLRVRKAGRYRRDAILRHLVDLQYQRNDATLGRAKFRVRGDTLEVQPAGEETILRVEFFGDEVERISEVDPLTGEILADRGEMVIYPATHYVTPAEKLGVAIRDIEAEMVWRCKELESAGKVLEAARLRQRTTFDLEMMREVGFCSGIENYSRHLSRREPGSRPWTLLDYFPADWLLVVDESHMSIPQVVGMFKNDRSRKEILVDYGFRLPSALDNRPLTFEEFEASIRQAIYVSATPASYEMTKAERVVEQLIRPTGVVDPKVTVLPTKGQIDDLMARIHERIAKRERVIVTTLTKRMAEELASYLEEGGVRVRYLHSEIDTLERIEILRDLRLGVFDVIVGINLLREGIDLPEVTLVAILDADKEGFLRSAWALIQTVGRAARNVGGEVVFYADKMTDSMQVAIAETERRRGIQERWNLSHGVTATTISKPIRDLNDRLKAVAEKADTYAGGKVAGGSLSEMGRSEIEKLATQLEAQMRVAAKELEFERAAALRDELRTLRRDVLDSDAAEVVARAAERAAGAVERIGARASAPAAPRRVPGTPTRTLVAPAIGSAADWLPGIRDEHDEADASDSTPAPNAEEAAAAAVAAAERARRRTWDPSVTPNVIKRRGERPKRRG